MGVSLLPDRERRHLLQFYLFPKMGYRTRLAWAGGLILSGLALQLLWPGSNVVFLLLVSGPLLLAGNSLLLVRGYDLTPAHSLRGGEWEKTTRDRFQQVSELERQVKSWDETFADLTCVSGFFVLLLLAVVAAVAAIALGADRETSGWAPVFALDAAVLLLPHWITGTRRGWRPVALRQQIASLETALRTVEGSREPPCQIQPMFEMAGKGKSRTPVSARVFIRFPDGPEDFLGLQLQVSLNDVQGTKYPYLYAVIVAKKPFGLLDRHFAAISQQLKGLTVERGKESDVEVIVIRQPTTRNSGYHTNQAAVRRIAQAAWTSVAGILGSSCPAASS